MKIDPFRKAEVYFKDKLAGILEETEIGYRFRYLPEYKQGDLPPISSSLPLTHMQYESTKLFSFFSGLCPEGWYKDIVCATRKIDPNDEFGLLLSTTSIDTIGAVTIRRY